MMKTVYKACYYTCNIKFIINKNIHIWFKIKATCIYAKCQNNLIVYSDTCN